MFRVPFATLLFGALLGISTLLTGAAARAATAEDEQVWLNLTAMGPVSGELIYFAEIQPRFGNGASGADQTLLRGAVGWKLSPQLSVYQGYLHIVLPSQGGRDVIQIGLRHGCKRKPVSRCQVGQKEAVDGQNIGRLIAVQGGGTTADLRGRGVPRD